MALSITHAFVSAVADEGNASLVQPSNWNAAHTLSGLGTGVQTFLETPSSANLAAAVTGETGTGALVFASTPTLVTPVLGAATFTSLTGSGATVTTSTPILDLSQTWNNAAVVFTGLKLNVTATAIAALSKYLEIQAGGAGRLAVGTLLGDTTWTALWLGSNAGTMSTNNYTIVGDTSGLVYFNDASSIKFRISNTDAGSLSGSALNLISTQAISWNSDTYLSREAAGIVAQKNTTSAQTLRVYNTTDGNASPTNYERGVFDWTTTANVLTIGTQAGGTGTVRNIALTAGSAVWRFDQAAGAGNGNVGALYNNTGPISLGKQGQEVYLGNQNGNAKIDFVFSGSANLFRARSLGVIGWSSTDDANNTSDAGLARPAAAVVEINAGTAAGVGYLRLNGVAVASLPAASSTYAGARGTVTNANSNTFYASVVAATSTSTAQIVPVFCTGAAWLIG